MASANQSRALPTAAVLPNDPEVNILDVGHGNSALILERSQVTVIDAGRDGLLLEALDYYGIQKVNTVVISHADEDHIAGLDPLLSRGDISIESVYLNSAESRDTVAWHAFRRALGGARKVHKTTTNVGIAFGTRLPVHHTGLELEVLAPLPENALGGEHGKDVAGRRQSPNSTSVVLRLVRGSTPLVLFAGDLDDQGLTHLLSETPDPSARVLIFPHHGGIPGSTDPEKFAKRLVDAVKPEVVVFSVSRRRKGFPHADTVRGVHAAGAQPHIVCTQLSQVCSAHTPNGLPQLSAIPARGKDDQACCGGTLRITTVAMDSMHEPTRTAHRHFVTTSVTDAMCVVKSKSP
jgi:beta-lactamase superfamily II metal-dependent hydrolase